VKDVNHKHELISDKDYQKHGNKSKLRYQKNFAEYYSEDNVENHHTWYDKHNCGINHFRIEPEHLPLSCVAFDNLH